MSGAHRFVAPGTLSATHDGRGLSGFVAFCQLVRFVDVFAVRPVANR